jgi:hypothetical protein
MEHVSHAHHKQELKLNYQHNVINAKEVLQLIFNVLDVQLDTFYNKVHQLHKLLVHNAELDV